MIVLVLKDVTRSAQSEYKRLIKANLIVIDDIMLFPVEKKQAVNFVNQINESTSFVIPTNKAPADWAKLLDDEVHATALPDRILFHCSNSVHTQIYGRLTAWNFFLNN
jgi:DNA replication protein DnaC